MNHHRFSGKLSRLLLTLLAAVTFFGVTNNYQGTALADSATATAIASPTNQNQTNNITDEQYRNASASQLAAMVRSGQVTPQELIRHAFSILAQDNPSLNAVIYTREQEALDEAGKLKDTGQPFYGVPFLAKGLLQLIAGGPNTNGLLPLAGNTIGATLSITKAFQNAGFIVIGATNFPEMGLFNVTNSKLYGPATNPWNKEYNPGGSSGGAAASTADGIVPLAGGNDAGGSIRIPASWTGLIGLKPTQGIITGDTTSIGAVNFAETKTMKDTSALFESLLNPKVASQVPEAPADIKGMTVAYSTKSPVGTMVSSDAINAVQNAVSFLKAQGFNTVEVDPPVDGQKLMQSYYLSATAIGSNANYNIQNKTKQSMTFDQVNPITWGLYQASKKLPADTKAKASDELSLIDEQMTAFHEKYPLYLTPTTATTAPLNSDPIVLPEYAEQLKNSADLSSDQQMQLIYDAWLHGLSKTPFTQLANLAGEPAISLPTYVSPSGMPLGIQLEAGKNQDRLLLKMGELFESNGLFKELNHQAPTPTPAAPNSASSSSQVINSTSSETSSSSIAPVVSSSSNGQSNEQPNYAHQQRFIIYTLKKVNLHKSTDFTKKDVIATYQKEPRQNRPLFMVTGYARSSNGRLRYEVKDINKHTKNYGKRGYMTAEANFVKNAYYQSHHSKVKVINQKGVNEYRNSNLTKKLKHYEEGKKFIIKNIVKDGLTTRFVLGNGHFVTGNKKYVFILKK